MTEAQIAKADKLYDAGKWSQAIVAYKKCIGPRSKIADDERSRVYFCLGSAHSKLNQPDASIEWYTKRIDLNIAFYASHAYYNRGLAYRAAGKYASALADFTKASTLYVLPDDVANCYRHRSTVYRDMKLHDLESADLEMAVGLSTDSQVVDDCKKRIAEIRTLVGRPAVAAAAAVAAGPAVDQRAIADAVAAALHAEANKRKREGESESAAAAASNKRLKPNEADRDGSGNGGGGGADSVSALLQPEPVTQLSGLGVNGVSEYLRSIDSAYIKSFADKKINGATLCNLTDALLTKLGVSDEFHRLRILSDVQRERESKTQPVVSAAAGGGGGGGGGMDSKHSVGAGATPTGVLSAHELISQLLSEQAKSQSAAAAVEEAKKCVVCLDGAKAVRFAPCNHICCCEKCGLGTTLTACPLCRSPITGRDKLFFA